MGNSTQASAYKKIFRAPTAKTKRAIPVFPFYGKLTPAQVERAGEIFRELKRERSHQLLTHG